jgi:hypothetical protein
MRAATDISDGPFLQPRRAMGPLKPCVARDVAGSSPSAKQRRWAIRPEDLTGEIDRDALVEPCELDAAHVWA